MRSGRAWRGATCRAPQEEGRPGARTHRPVAVQCRTARAGSALAAGTLFALEAAALSASAASEKTRSRSSKQVTASRPLPSGAHSAACDALGRLSVATGLAPPPPPDSLRASQTCTAASEPADARSQSRPASIESVFTLRPCRAAKGCERAPARVS